MKDNCGTVSEKNTMYFHPDHLGSSSYVTDKKGNFFEMIEYLPYGETLYDEAATVDKTEFRFTSKEQDAETGLYYYGARYRDAKTGVWLSVDPYLANGNYFPVPPVNDKAKERNKNITGMGGVFNSVNLNGYHYAGNNPVRFVDPDGNFFGCGGSNNKSEKTVDQFINALKTIAHDNGIVLDKQSLDALEELGAELKRTEDVSTLICLLPIANAIGSIQNRSDMAGMFTGVKSFDCEKVIDFASDEAMEGIDVESASSLVLRAQVIMLGKVQFLSAQMSEGEYGSTSNNSNPELCQYWKDILFIISDNINNKQNMIDYLESKGK